MKKFKIVFSPFALDDVKEAAKWYNSQQKGLGKRFKGEVKDVVNSISLNPFFASVKYDNVRTLFVKIFLILSIMK